MDDERNHRKQRHRRHRRHQGWEFTFLGETGNRAKLVPELVQNQLRIDQLFPLSNTEVGDRVVITQILSGKSMIHRLNKMGLDLGSEIRVISKTKSGSVIVCIQDEQIGLGAGMADRVMVTLAVERI